MSFFLTVLIGVATLLTGPGPRGLNEPDEGRYASDAFLLAWVVLPVIFFSLSDSKLPTYILPLLPALALIAGREMVCLMAEKPPLFTGIQSGFVVFFAVAVPLGFWLYGIQTYHWTRPAAPQYIPAVLFAAAVVYAVIRFRGILRAASTGPLKSIYCADDAWVLQPGPLLVSAMSHY